MSTPKRRAHLSKSIKNWTLCVNTIVECWFRMIIVLKLTY